MSDRPPSSGPLDPLVSSPSREGLTGTGHSTLYSPLPERDQMTLPPDGRTPEAQPQWRKDFPIDWPQDQYVARRDFAKFLGLTSFAFVVGQVFIGIQNILRRRGGNPPIQRVADLSSLPVGTSLVFAYPTPQEDCLVIRPEADVLVGYSQSCSHLSCAVVPNIADNRIHCPCHEGSFDLRTGRPIAGPPRRPLTRVILEVRHGVIYATGVERRTV